ncbi:MAG: SAM-dependent methyltransferase, partial [Deltaproteobacteria bacterium]|nr:SAM-dependent methyltransferase [Deltaproteobacteria bacterium]
MTSVTSLIKERIIERGKISFAEFMEMALYHPELGYYTSPRVTVGPEGDFYTSPATHPVFAALIAIQLDQMWRLLGSPKPFTLVEMGAGKGLLGREILAYVAHHSPALADAVQYVGLERRRMWAVKGQESWPKHPVSREADWGRLSANGITGCVVSNELLDALPTHKVVQKDGRLKEAYITLRDGRFVETVDELSTPLLETQLLDEGISLPEGHSTEVNLNLGLWVRDVAKRLQRGFVITFDYGYPARELYSPARAQGTIMTYYQHTYGTDPYLRIGEQDITSHVDFTAVILAGERNGLHFWGFLSQRDFLLNLGLDTFIEA